MRLACLMAVLVLLGCSAAMESTPSPPSTLSTSDVVEEETAVPSREAITLAPTRRATETPTPTSVAPTAIPTATPRATATSTVTRTPTQVTNLPHSGSVLREYWFTLEGFTPDELRASPNFPDSPDYCDLGTEIATTPDQGDNFGARLRGYITAPGSGEYRFWLGSDNGSEFWLSTDDTTANLRKLLDFDFYANYLDFDSTGEQGPAVVRMRANERYYFEALFKEDSSGFDWLAVAWQGQDIDERQVVGARYLSSEGLSCGQAAPPTRTPEATSTP